MKDKEIYRVKLACQNTNVYRVNTQLTKGTITLLYFFCFFFAYAHAKRVRQVSCERVRTVPCACDHLIHCFPVEGHICVIAERDNKFFDKSGTYNTLFSVS